MRAISSTLKKNHKKNTYLGAASEATELHLRTTTSPRSFQYSRSKRKQ